MMDIFFTIKPIQRMNMGIRLWQSLTNLHWLLVDIVRIPIRLKHLISQPIPGLKLLIILITISKFPFLKFHHRMFLSIVQSTFYFSIWGYGTVTTSQGALFLGGYSSVGGVATVACYNNEGWSRFDDLKSTRHYHRAVINGDKVFLVGGNGKQ